MNRRQLLLTAGSAAGLVALPQFTAQAEDVYSFRRTFSLEDVSFDQPITYFCACLMGSDEDSAMLAYENAEDTFLGSLIESLEDDGYVVVDRDEFIVHIDRFDSRDVTRTGFSFTVKSEDSVFDIYQKAIVATRGGIVQVWASISLDDSARDLLDLADEYMLFSAKNESDLPDMLPDEDDMADLGYEMTEEGDMDGQEF